ncbi:MAG: hypothetical protein M0Q15_11995 [Nevskia sp.]|nr:hypothetical protein [Nevskia sp.]
MPNWLRCLRPQAARSPSADANPPLAGGFFFACALLGRTQSNTNANLNSVARQSGGHGAYIHKSPFKIICLELKPDVSSIFQNTRGINSAYRPDRVKTSNAPASRTSQMLFGAFRQITEAAFQLRLNGSYGFGNLDEDKYNFFVTLEGSRVDAIAQSNRRSFLGTQDLRPYGFFDNRRGAPFAGGGNFPNSDGIYSGATPYGNVRTPGTAAGNFGRTNLTPCPEISPITGVCLFDTTPYIDIQPETSRFNLFSRGTLQLHEKVQAYTEIGYFYSDTKSRGTPSGVVGGGGYNPNDPFNPVFPTVQATLPVGHPNNPFNTPRPLSYLATDFGGRNGETTNQVLRFIGGFTGEVNGFEYDLGGGYIRSDLDQSRTGFILFPVLQAGLNSGVYRINNKSWELTGSILNITNELLPFDPYTYGGQNYNPSFAQAGAVGRFYNVGIKYRFH